VGVAGRTILLLAAAYNLAGGLGVLFLLDSIGPLIDFQDSGPALFRLFAGGTAVLFGIAYIAVSRNYQKNRPLLVYGTALKYWAFAIGALGFSQSWLSIQALLAFGAGNLVFAVLFTWLLARY
jgi:hypothetical protein